MKRNKRKLKRVKPKKRTYKKRRAAPTVTYKADTSLPFFTELRNLILKIAPPSFPSIEKSIRKIGHLKLAVATGIFLSLASSRVDLLVAGDDIDYKKLNNFIKNLEANMGLELRYVIMGTDELVYRYNMFDRFVRDILDSPHKKIVNRIKL